MSIRDITHSNNLGLSVLAKSNATTASGGIAAAGHANPSASAFSALLENAREIKGVSSVATKSAQALHSEAILATKAAHARSQESSGAHGAQFAAILGQAQEQYAPSAQAQYAPSANAAANTLLSGKSHALTQLATKLTYDDLKGRIAALEGKELPEGASARTQVSALTTEVAQVISTIEAAQSYQIGASAPSNPDEVVELSDKSLDFSPLLPAGLRAFMSDLKCPQSELDNFVNVMIFGSEDGPHGQNAAQYFGADHLSGAELSTRMSDLMARANINAPALGANDYNYVLRDPQAALGQTIGVSTNADLDERALERELDSTFKRDMALMQIFAQANNQSASIF